MDRDDALDYRVLYALAIAEIERLTRLLRDIGANRYWEGRWRDEKAENDKLRAALEEIASDPTGTSIYQAEIAKAALQPKEGEK